MALIMMNDDSGGRRSAITNVVSPPRSGKPRRDEIYDCTRVNLVGGPTKSRCYHTSEKSAGRVKKRHANFPRDRVFGLLGSKRFAEYL